MINFLVYCASPHLNANAYATYEDGLLKHPHIFFTKSDHSQLVYQRRHVSHVVLPCGSALSTHGLISQLDLAKVEETSTHGFACTGHL